MKQLPPPPHVFYDRKDVNDLRLGTTAKVFTPSLSNEKGFALIGWPDDRGVHLNSGRIGAKEAPNAIRKQLYKFVSPSTITIGEQAFVDWGNLELSNSLAKDHQTAAQTVSSALQKGLTPICIGGGNDFAYSDVLGLHQSNAGTIGVINIDAHFDVRSTENGLSSGTPYYRMLEEGLVQGENFIEFACQKKSCSLNHQRYLEKYKSNLLWLDHMNPDSIYTNFESALKKLTTACDSIVISLDMDAVKQSDAPGVSAPSPFGLSSFDVESIARLAGQTTNVKLLSVYEVCPPLDQDEQTSRLAASFIWNFVSQKQS